MTTDAAPEPSSVEEAITEQFEDDCFRNSSCSLRGSVMLHTPKPIPLDARIHVQAGRCLNGTYKSFALCRGCISKKTGDHCRFQGFRAFLVDPTTEALQYGPYFVGMEESDLKGATDSTMTSRTDTAPPRDQAGTPTSDAAIQVKAAVSQSLQDDFFSHAAYHQIDSVPPSDEDSDQDESLNPRQRNRAKNAHSSRKRRLNESNIKQRQSVDEPSSEPQKRFKPNTNSSSLDTPVSLPSSPKNSPSLSHTQSPIPDKPDAEFQMSFRPSVYVTTTLNAERRILAKTANVIEQLLETDWKPFAAMNPIYRQHTRTADARYMCDECSTSIFKHYFTCCVCGREICQDCYHSLPTAEEFRVRQKNLTAVSDPVMQSVASEDNLEMDLTTGTNRPTPGKGKKRAVRVGYRKKGGCPGKWLSCSGLNAHVKDQMIPVQRVPLVNKDDMIERLKRVKRYVEEYFFFFLE
jgi:hypothetical protein